MNHDESYLILISGVGGLIGQVVNLLELKNIPKSKRPDFKDIIYWLPFLVYPLMSAFMGYMYFDNNVAATKLFAFHIGVSTPLIIKSMLSTVPKSGR